MPWVVTLIGGTYHVHAWAKSPGTGVQVDARSVHFNWLLLIPLLAGTFAVAPGRRRALGAGAAILALGTVHVAFLTGVAEYRLLKTLGIHPTLSFAIFVFSQFYYSVGRIGIPILIWVPVGLREVILAPSHPRVASTPLPNAPNRRKKGKG